MFSKNEVSYFKRILLPLGQQPLLSTTISCPWKSYCSQPKAIVNRADTYLFMDLSNMLAAHVRHRLQGLSKQQCQPTNQPHTLPSNHFCRFQPRYSQCRKIEINEIAWKEFITIYSQIFLPCFANLNLDSNEWSKQVNIHVLQTILFSWSGG